MARTIFVEIPEGQESLYYSTLKSGDRFVWTRMARNVVLMSRFRKTGLTQRSLLPQLSVLWAALSDAEKLAWKNAGLECGKTKWRLFVQENCLRIINKHSVPGTPSLLHQSKIGLLHVGNPSSELKIAQLHPRSYWVSQKVPGKKKMYEPVLVTEDFYLPLTISLNYRAELSAVAENPVAEFYANVWSSYQGVDTITKISVPLTFATDWVFATATLSVVPGYVVGYDLHIDIEDLQGDLYVDNIKATHSMQNWCRDPYCDDINQGFTRAFYQVPKHWFAVSSPSGTFFESVYRAF